MAAKASHIMEPLLVRLDELSRLTEKSEDQWRLTFGLPALDAALTARSPGVRPGQVVQLCGGDAIARAALWNGVALLATLKERVGACVVAPRSRDTDVLFRLLMAEARVPTRSLRAPGLSVAEQERIQEAAAALWDAPLWIETGCGSVHEVEHECFDVWREARGIRLVVFDDGWWTDEDFRRLFALARDFRFVALVCTHDNGFPIEPHVRLRLQRNPVPRGEGSVDTWDVDVQQIEGPDASVCIMVDGGTGAVDEPRALGGER